MNFIQTSKAFLFHFLFHIVIQPFFFHPLDTHPIYLRLDKVYKDKKIKTD